MSFLNAVTSREMLALLRALHESVSAHSMFDADWHKAAASTDPATLDERETQLIRIAVARAAGFALRAGEIALQRYKGRDIAWKVGAETFDAALPVMLDTYLAPAIHQLAEKGAK